MFKDFKTQLTSFIKNETGVAAILGAILLPTMIGGTGLAVDGTRYLRAKNIIISAADQAALAAASVDLVKDGETREQLAKKFFNANIPSAYANVVTVKTFSFVDAGAAKGEVTVNYTINAEIKTILGSVIGVNEIAVTHTGQAVREIQDIEVVMALPMSGTMCSFKNRTPNPASNMLVRNDIPLDLKPDKDCTHFNAMKKGVQSFADTMFKNQTVSRFKLGFIPYNYKVRMPDTRNIPDLMLNNERAEPLFFENANDANPLSVILPLTANRDKINLAINNLKQSENGTAWSRTNLPTLLSALMLDPSQSRYFPGIDMPSPMGGAAVKKVFILLSDGSNIGCCFTNWQPGDFKNQYIYFHKPDNDQTLAYCETMKKYGITIYSIIFDVSVDDKGGREVNNLFARCASGAYSEKNKEENLQAKLVCKNKQNCYNIKTSDQLAEAYADIAQNYYTSRTSR